MTSDLLGDDLLSTVGPIAAFTLGADTPQTRRRVRALMTEIEPPEARLPSCLLGGQRCSRKSWILRWLEECRAREEARAREAVAAKTKAKRVADARFTRRSARPLQPAPIA